MNTQMFMRWFAVLLLLAIAGVQPAYAAGNTAVDLKSRDLESMRFRFVGPDRGNRASAVAGVPGNPNVYYVGAPPAGCGIQRRRLQLQAGFRQAAGAVHRRPGGGSQPAFGDLGRHRRILGDPQWHHPR